ncbi:DsbA family oxidoreductase [Avibacterium sp. 21-594]|uniref:DsbA family oxidoreductase n=1 Tax=Avibacterium sp. 21-594 TaxID=2911535 RepID=UPI00224779DA|nr:DsbA family oxidoreductase [Avibacterium sp. 21-594]MCW9716258.1 DsbA family oxidoreductase [Avibacterium sp. 21-594]
MKIDIFSDYACPFCYIGKRHLEQALAQFEHAEAVQVHHKAYELYPQASKQVENSTQQRIEYKYGKTPQGALNMIRGIEQMAQKAGIDMDYEQVQNTNMFDAHRLTKLAAQLGKESEAVERLFRAYFIDHFALSDHANLIQVGEEIGIDGERIRQMLDSDEFADAVRADEQEAQQLGVQAVPYFRINGVPVAGSVPSAHFLNLLQELWTQEQQADIVAGMQCGVDGCH